jgi:hypothetical protein
MTDAVVTNAGVSSNAALVRRDGGLDAALAGEAGPGPEAGPGQEGLALPAIPVSAGALIFDRGGRLLILKPTYKSGWTIPGGVMEADGETPWDACRREVREECGLEVGGGRLACMDFRRPRPGRQGGVRFLFNCGALSRRPSSCSRRRSLSTGWRDWTRLSPSSGARSGAGSAPRARAMGWSTWRMGAVPRG